jgi:hypothetical protein
MTPAAYVCVDASLTIKVVVREPDSEKPARAALSAALALYRAMDMTFWLSQAEKALA